MKPISAITIEFTAKVSLDIWELEDIKYSTPLASFVIGNVNISKKNVFVTFILSHLHVFMSWPEISGDYSEFIVQQQFVH